MTSIKHHKRVLGYLMITTALLWIVVATVSEIHLFLTEHDGIEFYRTRPYLLAVCVAVAIAIGATIKTVGTRALITKDDKAVDKYIYDKNPEGPSKQEGSDDSSIDL